MVPMATTRALTSADDGWRAATLEAGWGATWVARLGERVDAGALPGFLAEAGGRRVGLATFAPRADGVEVVTIQALQEGTGVGRLLMDRLLAAAVDLGAPRLWLITTNDNDRAIRFYQRWGMDLVRVVHDGVARSRAVKPTIPEVSSGGVAIRDELEFERRVRGGRSRASGHGPGT
jgi:GNAT superfamily N-acetyltransferase